MRLNEIIKRVQRQFGDDVEAQITEDDIVNWVNDACMEIASNNVTNQGWKQGTTPVVANTSVYALPADILMLRAVRANGVRLTRTTFEQLVELDFYNSTTTGQPTHYWILDNTINLYPIPSDNFGNLDVMYVRTPDKMSVGAQDREPDVPAQYHLRIVEYCIAQAAELDDNLAHYASKMNDFRNNLAGLRQDSEHPESEGTYPSITYVADGW